MSDSGVKQDIDFPVVAQFVLVDAVEIWIINDLIHRNRATVFQKICTKRTTPRA